VRTGAIAAVMGIGIGMLVQTGGAMSAEIAIVSTTSLKATLDKIGPGFERASGHTLKVTYGTSAPLRRQIDAGAAFDLAILVPATLDALVKDGKIVADTRTDIARSAIGVAIKAGAAKPDVESAEGLKRTLQAAKSISYSGEGASGKHFTSLLDRMGIAAQIKPRLVPLPSGEAVAPVARGEVEMAVITLANIVGVSGVEIAGVLPRDMQHYTVYTAGVATAAKNANGARALLALIMAPETTPVIEAEGMERVGR
jgi:molybdate transport system substrate-binding protein